ncbi:MAG: hypothetical protein WB239_16935 [Acidimicrobiia bacterium]
MKHRTGLITAASVVGVLAAGSVAIGANLGILNASGSDAVGALSVATTQPAAQIEQVDDSPTTSSTQTTQTTQAQPNQSQYQVEDAGTVSVTWDQTGVIDAATQPAQGWSSTIDALAPDGVAISFTDGTTTYTFTAEPDDQGQLRVDVVEPIVQIVTEPATNSPSVAPPAATSTYEGEHEDDSGEHEGRGDDD